MTLVGKRLGFSAHLAVLLVTVVGTNIGYTALFPYLPRLSAHLGLTSAGLAAFLSGFAVAKIVGQPLGGVLVDLWGLRTTAAAGLAWAVLGMAMVTVASSAYPAIAGRLVWGAADGVLTPVLYRALMVVAAEHGRDPTIGYSRLGSVAVLSLAGGPLVVGLVHPFVGYQAVLGAAAGLTLLNAVVAWLVLPGRAGSAPAPETAAPGVDGLWRLLRAIVFFGVVDLVANLIWGAMEPTVPLYLNRVDHDPTGRAAWVLGLGMAVFAVANPLLARLPESWRRPRTASLGLVVLGASCVLLGKVAVPAVGFAAIALFMGAQAYVYLLARTGVQQYGGGSGKAWGIFGMCSDAGQVWGPLAGVFLFQSVGTGAFPVLGIGTVLAAATLPVLTGNWRLGQRPQRTGSQE